MYVVELFYSNYKDYNIVLVNELCACGILCTGCSSDINAGGPYINISRPMMLVVMGEPLI